MIVATLSAPSRIRKPRAVKKTPVQRIQDALKGRNPNSFSAHLLRNELYRLTGSAVRVANRSILPNYRAFLDEKLKLYPREKTLLHQLIMREIRMIDAGNFTGNVAFPNINGIGLFKKQRKKLKKALKKVTKGAGKAVKNVVKEAGKVAKKGFQLIKKVNLAPARNAFLLLTKINARGLASGMYAGDRGQIDKLWKRFGGNPRNLNVAITQGRKKKPLLGGKQTAIRGIGDGGAVSVPAAIIAAAPIIAAVIKLIGNSKAAKEGDPNFVGPMPDGEGGNTSVWDQLKDLGGELLGSGALTSLAPDMEVIPEEGAPDDAGLPSDDDEINKSTSFEISPGLIAAGAIGLYFLTKK